MSDTLSPARTAPLALWRAARALLCTLHALFGAPEDVAARHTLMAKAHKLMTSWLRSAEAMLRRLLLIEASAYPKPNTRPILWPKRTRARRLAAFYPDQPADWRVSFRCFTDRAAAPRQARRRRAPQRFYSAWPLAERYEALIRVFNDPAAYARRLAKRLHAQPHRLDPMLRVPPEAAHRIEVWDALSHSAETRWRPPAANSS